MEHVRSTGPHRGLHEMHTWPRMPHHGYPASGMADREVASKRKSVRVPTRTLRDTSVDRSVAVRVPNRHINRGFNTEGGGPANVIGMHETGSVRRDTFKVCINTGLKDISAAQSKP